METGDQYELLKKRFEEKRGSEPEPHFANGSFIPQIVVRGGALQDIAWDKSAYLQEAVRRWHRFSWSSILRVAEVVGWEKIILEIEKKQKQGVIDAAMEYRRQTGLTTHDMDAMYIISVNGTLGVGFDHTTLEHTPEREVGMAYMCPMIQGIRDMGMENSPLMKDFSLWCDTYDNMELRATSPDIWYTHTHCIGKGDRYCRYCVDYRKKDPADNYYQTLKKNRDVKRQESDDAAPGGTAENEFRYGNSIQKPVVIENLGMSKLGELQLGVRIQRRIVVSTVLIGAYLIGWENFINSMYVKEIPRLRELSRNLGTKWNITGTTALDGAVLMHLGMLGMGFDDHQAITWTSRRVEGVARTCPLVESAKESGLESEMDEMHLWCDAWHNANAGANNPNVKCTFTHCLAKGDKLCRWVVE
jgi:hypothetical protein